MTRDDTLESLRRAILNEPDENTPRAMYADRMYELGRHDEADLIRRQLENPAEALTVPGTSAGLPLAATVTYRRGFVHTLTVPVNHLRRLGDAVRDHPVARIRVEATGGVRIALCEPFAAGRLGRDPPPAPGSAARAVGHGGPERPPRVVAVPLVDQLLGHPGVDGQVDRACGGLFRGACAP
jgi:uncharacterized protein (TIGR02996 family)